MMNFTIDVFHMNEPNSINCSIAIQEDSFQAIQRPRLVITRPKEPELSGANGSDIMCLYLNSVF